MAWSGVCCFSLHPESILGLVSMNKHVNEHGEMFLVGQRLSLAMYRHLTEVSEAKTDKELSPTLGFFTLPTRPLTPLDQSSLSFPGRVSYVSAPMEHQRLSKIALGSFCCLFSFFANSARPFQKAMCVFDTLEQSTVFSVDSRVF